MFESIAKHSKELTACVFKRFLSSVDFVANTHGEFAICVFFLAFHVLRVSCILRLRPLPPVPLAVAGLLVVGLVAWRCSDRLVGLLAC